MEKLGLYKKLLEAQKSLKSLAKSGKNTFHKYTYTTASDVLEPVREVCSDVGLVIQGSVIDQEITDGKASVVIELTIIDPETGEKLSTLSPGYGEDWSHREGKATGDKAVYKAITGGMKYAVRTMFCLPSDDDPEKDSRKPDLPFKSSEEAVKWASNVLNISPAESQIMMDKTPKDSKGTKAVNFYKEVNKKLLGGKK